VMANESSCGAECSASASSDCGRELQPSASKGSKREKPKGNYQGVLSCPDLPSMSSAASDIEKGVVIGGVSTTTMTSQILMSLQLCLLVFQKVGNQSIHGRPNIMEQDLPVRKIGR